MCEEFKCLPTEALRELRRAPDGLVAQVLEARAFMAAYHTWESAKKKEDLPKSALFDLVMEIEMTERHRQLMERTSGSADD